MTSLNHSLALLAVASVLFACDSTPNDGCPSCIDAGTLDAPMCRRDEDCRIGRCIGRICVEVEGSCATDSDCSGDRYCCTGDCAEGGDPTCIPYGTGPRGNVNVDCEGIVTPGLFEPSLQCEWLAPPDGDAFPDHVEVLATAIVGDLGNGIDEPDVVSPGEILINAYNYTDGGEQAAQGVDPRYFGVLRVLNGQTCAQLETIHDPDHPLIGAASPAIGDLDGDSIPEIVALTANSGLIAFRWNGTRHERYWVSSGSDIRDVFRWDGPAIHDIDDDGKPEVLSQGEVFDGETGARINVGQAGIVTETPFGAFPVVADIDGDGEIELASDQIYRWNGSSQLWEVAYTGPGAATSHTAIADFGSPSASGFDPSNLDGVAEIVAVSPGRVRVLTLDGSTVLDTSAIDGEGPPTVGDFDADGFPEIAVAGSTRYWVVDFDCENDGGGCEGEFIRWSAVSQDSSSERTGSSIFDFDGDGQAEVVYADECFTRIYNGRNGDVLYSSFRTSCTWYENPTVADPDRDQNTEIIVGSNSACGVSCPLIDPIHPGLRCDSEDDCASGRCEAGLCRCAGDGECDAGTACESSIRGGDDVCRAVHPADAAQRGVRVLRDALDRWVPSRPIWNQHSYSITNVGDRGEIPRTRDWVPNHSDPERNNYRQNTQGEGSGEAGALADITGRLDDTICQVSGGTTMLVSTVCNRGARSVGAALPATFYLGPPEDGDVLCTSYTSGAVPTGGCLEVSCELTRDIERAEVHVRVNDDGSGGSNTIECNPDNNGDVIIVAECSVLI